MLLSIEKLFDIEAYKVTEDISQAISQQQLTMYLRTFYNVFIVLDRVSASDFICQLQHIKSLKYYPKPYKDIDTDEKEANEQRGDYISTSILF